MKLQKNWAIELSITLQDKRRTFLLLLKNKNGDIFSIFSNMLLNIDIISNAVFY